MSSAVFPLASELAMATALSTPYATGKVRMVKAALALTKFTVIGDLTAIECDYTGYAEKTLTAIDGPYLDPAGGYSFVVPTQYFAVGATPTVGNDCYGGWIEDSTGALLMAFQFNTPVAMQAAHQALPLGVTINFFGSGSVIISVAGVPN